MSAVGSAEGEFMPLQKDESKVQDSPAVDTSEVHQEGIEHIKDNTEALSQQQAPASNPGSDDPSGGIAAGSGGTSSEPTLLDYSGEGAQKEVETSNKGTTSVDQEAGAPSGSDAPLSSAAAGAAVAATSEPANVEQRDVATTAPDSADAGTGTGSTGKEINMADSAVKDDSQHHNEETHQEEAQHEAGTAGDAGEETREKAADDAAAETKRAPTGGDDEDTKAPSDDSKGPVGRVLENKSAIPTAGGERLGEKHWGESKIVPDVPKKSDEEGTGQTDQRTADNTAKNAGGGSSGAGEAEGKQSMTDKIKEKLHMG